MKVYLDNAATTAMDKEVISAMISVMENNFGNPSSVHSFGRSSRAIIEKARKKLQFQPSYELKQGLKEALEWYKLNKWF